MPVFDVSIRRKSGRIFAQSRQYGQPPYHFCIYREEHTDAATVDEDEASSDNDKIDDVESFDINLSTHDYAEGDVKQLEVAMKSNAPISLHLGRMLYIFSSAKKEEKKCWSKHWLYKKTGELEVMDGTKYLTIMEKWFVKGIEDFIDSSSSKIRGISVADRALVHFKPFLLQNLRRLQTIKVKSREDSQEISDFQEEYEASDFSLQTNEVKSRKGTNETAVVDLIQNNSPTLKSLILRNMKFKSGVKITCPLPLLQEFAFENCTGEDFHSSVLMQAPSSLVETVEFNKDEDSEEDEDSEDDEYGDGVDYSEDDYSEEEESEEEDY